MSDANEEFLHELQQRYNCLKIWDLLERTSHDTRQRKEPPGQWVCGILSEFLDSPLPVRQLKVSTRTGHLLLYAAVEIPHFADLTSYGTEIERVMFVWKNLNAAYDTNREHISKWQAAVMAVAESSGLLTGIRTTNQPSVFISTHNPDWQSDAGVHALGFNVYLEDGRLCTPWFHHGTVPFPPQVPRVGLQSQFM